MNPLAEILTCLCFFSRLPLRADEHAWADAPSLAASVRMLPLAGLLLGCAGAAALAAGAAAGLSPGLAALGALLAGTLLTGGLHEDGLADTADGFGGGGTPERKLAIMRDSRIGTYGVLAIAFSLALRAGALQALLERGGPLVACAALVGAASLSRPLALLPMSRLPPARGDGLGHGFGRPAPGHLAVCFVVGTLLGLALPLAARMTLGHAFLACACAWGAAALLTRLAWRQIGGHTGDCAGAAQQVAETAYLLGLLALPGWL